MSKITTIKLARAITRDGRTKKIQKGPDGNMVKQVRPKRVVGYKPPQPRELVTCDSCGRQKYLSVGQIWRCRHGKKLKERKCEERNFTKVKSYGDRRRDGSKA